MGAAKLNAHHSFVQNAVDAKAICEAAQRPSMRFVAIKSEEQQASGLVFRTRDQDQAVDLRHKAGFSTKSGWFVFRVQGL